MEVAEIETALAQSRSLPHGRNRTERLEMLAAAAKSAPNRALEGNVLLELAKEYTYAGERDLAPLAYGRLLRIYDEFPVELGPMSRSVHWYLKWMTWGLIENPAVPLPTVYRWLDELDSRYRQRGYSARPVLSLRSDLARELGDHERAARLLDAALAAPRDDMADCDACERNGWGANYAVAGDDDAALAQWRPVLDGERSCAQEPHRVLGQVLLPLLRTGNAVRARSAHLTGYSLVRHGQDLRRTVAEHIEFCALTGNEARGLEILAEHSGRLTDHGADAAARLWFAVGVSVLLRRVSELGLGDLEIGRTTVDSVRGRLRQEIDELSARYDARNGSAVLSTRIAERLAQQPFVDQLPLGLRTALPRLVPAPAPVITSNERVSSERVSSERVSGERVSGERVSGERVSEARRLAEQAAIRLVDQPEQAEQYLRQALSVGAVVLPAEHLARLSSQLVMVVSGQPGREFELADVALAAAARWEDISEADAVHFTFVAARALHRGGQYGEAAALFEPLLAAGRTPYPAGEMAILRRQYAESLRKLDRFREAATQFIEGARLVRDDPERRELQAELAWSAASALDYCGADEQAVVVYQRAAELWGELGRIGSRARCLRSAAWLQMWGRGMRDPAESGQRPWLATMCALVAELERLDESAPSTEVTNELIHSRSQLADMRSDDEMGEPGN